MLGYSEVELLNLFYQDITYQGDLATDTAMAEKKVPYSMIKTYITKDGTKLKIRLHVTPSLDENGNFEYYLVWVTPILYPDKKCLWIMGSGISIIIILEFIEMLLRAT